MTMALHPKSILFSEWRTDGREVDMHLPLIYFLEKRGHRCLYKPILDLWEVIQSVPDFSIISGSTGGPESFEYAKLCHRSKIDLFTMFTEGAFSEAQAELMLWGWNKDKTLYENSTFVWSDKSLQIALSVYNGPAGKIKFSGSTGHDKYTIYKPLSMPDRRGFKKVIGFAGFNFHSVHNQKESLVASQGQAFFDLIVQYQKKSNDLLKALVKKNRDILFLIKSHPADNGIPPLEAEGIENESNVVILHDDSPIFEVISASDFWLSFVSSTSADAWLLGKPSLAFCTRDEITRHSYVCQGGLLSENIEQIQGYINELFRTGRIADYEAKSEFRNGIIRDLVGFNDGMNHVRFLSFLRPLLESAPGPKGRWAVNETEKVVLWIKHIRARLAKHFPWAPYLKRHALIYNLYNPDQLKEIKRVRYPQLDAFYAKNFEKIDHLYRTYADEFELAHAGR